LVLGRSLERVDMTARLLSACFGEPSGSPEWVTTLRCCSAHEAFLRTYRRAVDGPLVAEFLLLDRLFPRSAVHALGVADHCLAELGPSTGRAGQEDEARRILGRARNELDFAGVRELVADLPSYLKHLQGACAEASDAIARRFFRQSAPVEWHRERVTPG
ncbi:MAG: alpha-E domain-containing protein, partial [Actinobacteria bacterium]|nr:alpha-E domain-containing protein [Actinomycetota bacterium]